MPNFKEDLKKKLKIVGVKKNQTLILTTDLLKMFLFFKKKNMSINIDDIIEAIKDLIGKNGNIIIYSFFWEFFKTKTFNYDNSKSASGSLSNYLLNKKEFIRTKHPVYSILAWGKDAKKIYNINHTDCFSKKSPFGYLLKKNSQLLFININFKKTGFPFFHIAEQEVNVYYRYYKIFRGEFIKNKKKKKISFRMFVRKKNYNILTYYSDSIDKILKNKNSIKKVKAFDSEFTLLNLKTIYDLTIDELKKEQKMILRKETKYNQ